MHLLKKSSWQGRIPFLLPWPKQVRIDDVHVLIQSAPTTSHVKRRLLLGGYETAERTLIRSFVRPGAQVLELGASLGIISSFIGLQIGESGALVCVEPDARLAAHFWRQLRANSLRARLVNALCCPLWEDAVPESLVRQGFRPAGNTLTGAAAQEIVVEINGTANWLTAKEICRLEHLMPSTVIIDIEGTELIWVEYPPRFPTSVDTVIVEMHPTLVGPEKAAHALQAILSEGFRIVAFWGSVFALQR